MAHSLLQPVAVVGHWLKCVHGDAHGSAPQEADEVHAHVRADVDDHLAAGKPHGVAQAAHTSRVEPSRRSKAPRAAACLQRAAHSSARRASSVYVATNSTRHLDELYSSDFVNRTPIFRSQTFGRSVLDTINADLYDQILVGKVFSRSTRVCANSKFFLRAIFSKFLEHFENVRPKISKMSSEFRQILTNEFVSSSCWVTNWSSSAT